MRHFPINALLLVMALIITILVITPSEAHVPVFPDGNENISSAYPVGDPSKSWAIYSALEPGIAQYYSFEIKKGERILISLLTSTRPEDFTFFPRFALMGLGLEPKGLLPGFVESPEGYSIMTLEGNRSNQPTYEPFGPSSYLEVAELELPAPESGRCYIAIYDTARGGNYCLVVGYRETFTLEERILTPINLISIYRWEGQSLAFIFAPMIVVLILGGLFIWHRYPPRTPFNAIAAAAGLIFLGSSAIVITQIAFNLMSATVGAGEIAISLALAALAAILGLFALFASRSKATIIYRICLLGTGIVGLFLGAGLIIGPILSILASVLPDSRR
jgi:hypothetical protein